MRFLTRIFLYTLMVFFVAFSYFPVHFMQKALFSNTDYILFQNKAPYIFVFMFINFSYFKIFISKHFSYIKKYIIPFVCLYVISFYMTLSEVCVFYDNNIIDYNFYKPSGTEYSYTQIKSVDVGFNNEGKFHYIVFYGQNKKIDLYQSKSEYKDTYKELEIIDSKLINLGVLKNSSMKNIEKCEFDSYYIERFKRIINNK